MSQTSGDPLAAAMARNMAAMAEATARRIAARQSRSWLTPDRQTKLIRGEAPPPLGESRAIVEAYRKAQQARGAEQKSGYGFSRSHPLGMTLAEHKLCVLASTGKATSVLAVALGCSALPAGVHALVRKATQKLDAHGVRLLSRGFAMGWEIQDRPMIDILLAVKT